MGGGGAQRREAQHPAVHQGQEGHLHNQEERQGGAQAPQQHTVQDRARRRHPRGSELQSPHPRDMAGMGGGLRPAPCSRQVREPAPAHPPLHGGLVGRAHRPQRGTPLRPRRRVLG